MDIKSGIEKLRTFGLSNLAIDNGTSIFVLMFMIVLFGWRSYDSMPKEQFPEVALPTVFVNTVYFGNSSKDIESLITRPIEKELKTVSGVKDVRSTSLQDYSVITVEFNSDIEIELATRKVKDAVDKAKADLPQDLTQEPQVFDVNLSEIPIVTVNISGNYSNDELKRFGEYLEDRIEELKEISDVEIKGVQDREVKIDVDLVKMQLRKVSFQDIENAVSSENLTMSGGEILNDNSKRSIRVIGEYSNMEEIQNTIVKAEAQQIVFLKDIADVSFGFVDRTSYAREDKLPVVSLDVIKRKGQNLLVASDKIKDIVEKAQEDVLPGDLKISFFNDQSVNTRREVSNLENSIISGVILVVLVLLFFMGIRNALFVGIAIPLSMLMGFIVLNAIGYTLNIVVLFSLILALGMLVDNGIVIVENILRFRQNGYDAVSASKYGAGEVAVPIITSTATTVAAFLPLAFWPGIFGNFMKFLPITLITVLGSSLFVALVINPVLTKYFMKVDTRSQTEDARVRKRRNLWIGLGIMAFMAVVFHFGGVLWFRNALGITILVTLINFYFLRPAAFRFQATIMPKLESVYLHFLERALRIPKTMFFSTFGLLILAIVLLGLKSPKVIFFPDPDPIYINAFIELPIGKDIEATNAAVDQLEDKVFQAIQPYSSIVESVLTQIGENTSDPNSPPEPGASPNKARLTVSFKPADERNGVSTYDVMEEVREAVQGLPGVQIVVDKNAAGPPAGKPINIELRGEDINELVRLSEEAIVYINKLNIQGIEKLQTDIKLGQPELIVQVDREAARRYEISTYSIANALRTSVFGKEISKYKQGEEEYPIFVRLNNQYRNNLDELLNQYITFRNPANGRISQVPVSAVSNMGYSSSYNSIKRRNLDRVVTIYSNVNKGYNANEIVNSLRDGLNRFDMPEGYTLSFTGEQEQQADNIAFLSTALNLALFLVLFIIIAQFNSVVSPLIIMITVLFSTIGVFLGYVITGMDIVIVMTGVGIISLAGVVVNNAIVLIDYTELLSSKAREQLGLAAKAVLPKDVMFQIITEAGATRLRPVLLTAITTILGLVPLAIGLNFNFFTLVTDLDPQIFIGGDNKAFWGPLSWTVIYGLTFATFLTLILVPVMYWLVYLLKRAMKKKLGLESSVL
jgi:multidrug efflux pump